ncbi:MAG: hypothetical protein LBN05_01280 [Oscillospiraceae bacterium]|jgi:hypothetical protein|nr:hypothetical protein [Oscillospiraceae bacterium]
MKKLLKTLKIAGISLLSLLVAATGYYLVRGQLFPPTKVGSSRMSSTSILGADNPVSDMATLGYVFVAKVEKITDYHANKLLRKFPAFIEKEFELHFPNGQGVYSELNVTIVKNIKGDLPEGEEISIYAGFGYNALLTKIEMLGFSEIPEIGKTYLFQCNTTFDNNLVIISGSETLLDGEVNAENVEEFEIVRTYAEAAIEAQDEKNVPEIVLKLNEDRDIFMSKYDDDYTHKGQKIPDEEIVGKE